MALGSPGFSVAETMDLSAKTRERLLNKGETLSSSGSCD